MSDIDATATVLKHDISRYLPVRVIVRKKDDGVVEAYTENSFSMDWSTTRAQIYWSGKAYSVLGEHNLNGPEWAAANCGNGGVIYDPLAEDCPIEIDWDTWLKATNKFDKRNAPFKVKEAK